jgi:hypothetical protein
MLRIYVFVPNIRPILRLEVVTSSRKGDCPHTCDAYEPYDIRGFHMADIPRSNFELALVRNMFCRKYKE